MWGIHGDLIGLCQSDKTLAATVYPQHRIWWVHSHTAQLWYITRNNRPRRNICLHLNNVARYNFHVMVSVTAVMCTHNMYVWHKCNLLCVCIYWSQWVGVGMSHVLSSSYLSLVFVVCVPVRLSIQVFVMRRLLSAVCVCSLFAVCFSQPVLAVCFSQPVRFCV